MLWAGSPRRNAKLVMLAGKLHFIHIEASQSMALPTNASTRDAAIYLLE